METITAMFSTLAALVAAGLIVSEFIEKFWKLDGFWAQIRAVVVTMALGELGAGFQWGMFSDPATCGTNAWYICGGAIGLVGAVGANWAFTTPVGQQILQWLKLRPKT